MGLIFASLPALAGQLTLKIPKDTLYEITSDAENKKVAAITEAVKGANERLDAFNITREGDVITLSFSFWTGGEKVKFDLVGKKPEYYRMAMGVSIAETLGQLAKKDTRIAPAGGSKDKDNIFLDILHGSGGKPPPKPQPNRVSAKAPGKEIDKDPAPKKTAPQKPAASSVGLSDDLRPEDAEWQRIKDSGDIDAYEKFLKSYPRSMHKYAAKRKIKEIGNQAAEERKKRQTEQKRKEEEEKKRLAEEKRKEEAARKRIAEQKRKAEEQKRKAQVEQKRKAKLAAEEKKRKEKLAAEKRVTDSFNKAVKTNTSASLEKFIKNYPKSVYAEKARVLIVNVVEDEVFAAGKKSSSAMRKYVKRYPKGRHSKEAKGLLAKMEDDEAFEASKGSLGKLEGYISQRPKGRHVKEANALIDKFLSSGPPRLRVPQVKEPPKVDGVADEALWGRLRPLTVKFKQNGKGALIPSATVKAVHSGGRIYFMVQWKDKSEDTVYRPYKWDAKANRHVPTEKLDDAFSVALYKGKAPDDSCMLVPEDHEVDIWVWRAFLSGISGYASDQSIVTSRERLRKSTPHMAKDGKGQIWVRNLPDKGKLGWKYVMPMPNSPRKEIPSYTPNDAQGSAADVSARGAWKNGVWTVEFSRALKTGNPDDADISDEGQTMVSFAAYDKADRQNHSSGKIVRLELLR